MTSDIELARQQHTNYVSALADSGLMVTILPADVDHPDCVFVEDQAVVIDGHTTSCTWARIQKRRTTSNCRFPDKFTFRASGLQNGFSASMDGGDILRLGDLFFVGRSTRTNDAGIQELKNLLDHLGYELRVIDIPSTALHLTSISSTPSDNLILTAEGFLKPEDFGELPDGCEVIMMPAEEVYGCNTIGLPNNKVLVAEGYPTVTQN